MNILFQEKCSLCKSKVTVSEFESYYEGDFMILENGEKIPYPTQIKNKTIAKRYFKNQGWLYHKKQVFCPSCKDRLNNGYLVLDKYNSIYDNESSYDEPNISCVMNNEESLELLKYSFNGEKVFRKKALPVVCQFLNYEIKNDIVGYIKAHPDTTLVSDLDLTGFHK